LRNIQDVLDIGRDIQELRNNYRLFRREELKQEESKRNNTSTRRSEAQSNLIIDNYM
jgi:hypothetical protein